MSEERTVWVLDTDTKGHRRREAPRRFKLVNLLSRQVLAEGVGAAEGLATLRTVPSIVDVNVYVWEPTEDDWRGRSRPSRHGGRRLV